MSAYGAAAPKSTAAPLTFNPEEKSLADIQRLLANGSLSSEQLVQAYLARIERIDRSGPAINSILALNPEASRIAAGLDAERRSGKIRGPLHGIPVLLKDNIESLDPMPTTAGSLALKDNLTGRDAPIVVRLRDAGAIILGKTNLSEWANIRSNNSSSGWSAVGGLTRNPYALNRNPCGSSSGSGAAIAASLAVLAVGTETDGSITCPSAVNGLVGFKPTVGLLSRTHIVPISNSQDTPGPMARSVFDAAAMLSVMAGSDPADKDTLPADRYRIDYTAGLSAAQLQGKRIGVLKFLTGYHPALDTVFAQNLEMIRQAGAVIVEINAVENRQAIQANELNVLLTEFKHDLGRYLQSTPAKVGPRSLADVIAFNVANRSLEMPYFGQELFELANASKGIDDSTYLNALKLSQAEARLQLNRLLKDQALDALIAPTTGPAWTTDLVNGDNYSGSASSLPAIAGYPHLTVPMGFVNGLPVGISIITGKWQDQQALNIGYAFEQLSLARKPPTYAATLP
jgi:amidase